MCRWILLVLLLLILWEEAFTGTTRALFDRSQLPKILDTDMIELYHLRSYPLLLIDTPAGTFSTQTTGLALRSTTTGETIVLQYKPVNYSNCFLPIIVEEEKNASLIWDKRAEVVHYNSIDPDFWQQSTFLARINGVVYKNYIRWIETYVETNRQFSPQSICSSVNDLSCFTFAETWETFLADSYQAFASFSVRLNAILPPRAVELRYLSFHEPVEFQLSSSASSNPTVYPTSRPSLNPTAITAAPSMGGGEGSDSVPSDSSPIAEGSVSAFTDDPFQAGGSRGRHFSDDANGNNYSSESTTDESNSSIRKGKRRRLESSSRNPSKRHLRYSRVTPTESVEDSELDRPPRGGGYFPPSDDPLAASGGGGYPSEGNLEEVSVSEVAEYYSNIMGCMEEYQLGDFTNALKSCMSETVGYVHIDGERYYRIKHRYPFIYVYEYLEYIPDPMYSSVHGADYADMGIIFFIGVTAFLGFVASMAKLQVAEFFCADGYLCNFSGTTSHDIDKSASEDGSDAGYTQHQSRVSRVMTRVYSSMGWKVRNFSSTYSRIPTSDDDLAVKGLKERAERHSFGKETILDSVDEEDVGRIRGNSGASSGASSTGYIGIPRMGSVSFDASSPRVAAKAVATSEVEGAEVSLEMRELNQ